MPIFSRFDYNTLFVHIPKTGGTTIESMVSEAGWKMTLFDDHSGSYPSFPSLPCAPQHMHKELLDTYVDYSKINRAFTVVRNPVKRFVSEFFYQKPRFRDAEVIEKRDFERWARSSLERMKDDPFCFDNHMRPQSEFVGEKIRVFKFEEGLEVPLREIFPDDFGGLTVAQRHRIGHPASTVFEVPKKVLNALEVVYSSDFERFGYTISA